jgi:hypothetical protein
MNGEPSAPGCRPRVTRGACGQRVSGLRREKVAVLDFRSQWAAHDVRIRHDGIKRLRHPEVGSLDLTYQSLDLPMLNRAVHDLTIYTAEPGTTSEDRLKLLAS